MNTTTILTPNRRLSAVLLQKFNQEQLSAQKNWWPTFDVLPLTSWLQRLWHTYTTQQIKTHPLLLSPLQEQLLWEEILKSSPEHEFLLQLANTAELAKSAWSTLKQWGVNSEDTALTDTEDGAIFQKWAEQFAKRCKLQHWVDSNSLTDIIIQKIKDEEILLPKKIILAGFTEVSPQHQKLFETCADKGCKVSKQPSPKQNIKTERVSFIDETAEILAVARWAKKLYDTHPQKNISIGCVVPNLEKCRDKIIKIFTEVFTEKDQYTINYIGLPFNISAGKMLAPYPVIHIALQLLQLNHGEINFDMISKILRSPFISAAETEMLQRAEFEALLRRENQTTLTLEKCINQLLLKNYSPILTKTIQTFLKNIPDPKMRLPLSEWAPIFMQLLTSWGWPGERSLSSQEYQVVQAWLDLLVNFAGFESVLGEVNYNQAFRYLLRLASNTIFQPQSPDAPIQILGMLEATEMPFDHLWIMGMDDLSWPPAPQPNPFIPMRLQKQLVMPHATAERELQFSKHLLTQLKGSAENIIFSHVLQEGDVVCRASPLITDVPEIQSDQLPLANYVSPAEYIYESKNLECFTDNVAPAISEFSQIRGGVTIFKYQTACPFRAFAELRLHARPLEHLSLGLRAQEKGTIIHKILELLWRELQTQDNLIKLSHEELKEIISRHVSMTLKKIFSRKKQTSRYFELEFQRIEKLIFNWLEIEKSRPPFKVLAQESTYEISIANIPITLRIDRIDELENGKKLIIDYKTGKNNSIKAWFGEIDEPQLPLYCITDTTIVGISFAQIVNSEMELKGVSQTDINISSVKKFSELNYVTVQTWPEQVALWKIHLEKTAYDFSLGHAEVAPRKQEETCRYCGLQTLCRINSHRGEQPLAPT